MKYLNALNIINGVGPQKMRRLLGFFGESERIWKADLADLKSSKIGDSIAEKIVRERKNINPDEEWEKLQKENIQMITSDQPEYPQLLKEISHPPFLLYLKSHLPLEEMFNMAPMVSIVGSRKFTSYGSQAAHVLARELASAGITIVSGMAIGIDSVAHRSTLDKQGQTVAVLGNSLDDAHIYPRVNFNLSREIMDSGALVSDYPIATSASEFTFPARNRIIAGLSLGTLVVEAGEKSGALITAELALEFNREVFAVPGSIFSQQSAGTIALLKKGAKPVTGIKDILEELNLNEVRKNPPVKNYHCEKPEEKTLLNLLSSDPVHIDNLVKLSKMGTADVASTLAIMEIKGWTKNIGGQNYIKI